MDEYNFNTEQLNAVKQQLLLKIHNAVTHERPPHVHNDKTASHHVNMLLELFCFYSMSLSKF